MKHIERGVSAPDAIQKGLREKPEVEILTRGLHAAIVFASSELEVTAYARIVKKDTGDETTVKAVANTSGDALGALWTSGDIFPQEGGKLPVQRTPILSILERKK